MANLPKRKTSQLHIGRSSVPGAIYFITICTANRQTGLMSPDLGDSIQSAWQQLHEDDDIELLCSTVMPDHIHCLYRLGKRLSLSKVQSKFKALTRDSLEDAGLSWQRNFYDHKLRHSDSLEDFTFYIFMNPYVAGLIDLTEKWPWWQQQLKHKSEWMSKLKSGRYPHPEWLKQTPKTVRTLDRGE